MKNADPLRFLKRKKDRTPSKYATQSSRSQPNTQEVASIIQSRLQQAVLLKQNCYDPNKYYSSSCEKYLRNINYQKSNNSMQKSQSELNFKANDNPNDQSIQNLLVSFKKINNYKEKLEVRELTFKKIDFDQSQGFNKLKAVLSGEKVEVEAFEETKNEQNNDEMQLKQCQICGRKFNTASYQKHSKVCEKVFVKKRKQFSSEKQRSQSKQKKGK